MRKGMDIQAKPYELAIGNKLDILGIVEKSRNMDYEETMKHLKWDDPFILMSWGFHQPSLYNERLLRFKVNGHHHKGWVWIAINGMDLYDVYLTNRNNKVVDAFGDLYFDQLRDAIDDKIEKIDEYDH